MMVSLMNGNKRKNLMIALITEKMKKLYGDINLKKINNENNFLYFI